MSEKRSRWLTLHLKSATSVLRSKFLLLRGANNKGIHKAPRGYPLSWALRCPQKRLIGPPKSVFINFIIIFVAIPGRVVEASIV